MGRSCRLEGDTVSDVGDLLCCNGGVGKALGGRAFDVFRSKRGDGGLSPGENGGVCTELSIDNRGRAESGLGVVRDDPLAELSWESFKLALAIGSSIVVLRELRGVLGVDLVIVRLRARPPPPAAGSVKSAGVTLPIESAQGLVFGVVGIASSVLLSRAFLLSLLRSLMPFVDGSRLALALKNVLATSECDEDGVAEFVISTGEKVNELPVLDESAIESVSCGAVSIHPAGVGGTGPKEVPNCGAGRILGRRAGFSECRRYLSEAPLAL
jgi:hypothetical protein